MEAHDRSSPANVEGTASALVSANKEVTPKIPSPRTHRRVFLLLQVLRAVAAMMVVLHHVVLFLRERFGIITVPQENGAAGVDIFFVISGFVMVLSSHNLPRSWEGARTFLARRLERIVPLYWIATTLELAVIIAKPADSHSGVGSAFRVAASYLFLPTPGQNPWYPILMVGWTLRYEMLFYVLFAVAMGFRIPVMRFVLPALVAIALPAYVSPASWPALFHSYGPVVLEFIYGVFLGQAVIAGWTPTRFQSLAGLALGAVALMAAEGWVTRPLALGIPAAVVVMGAIGMEGSWGLLMPGWLLELGDASYAIYLVHGFVLIGFRLVASHIHLGRLATIITVEAAALTVSAAAGVLVHRTLETRIQRFFRSRRMA